MSLPPHSVTARQRQAGRDLTPLAAALTVGAVVWAVAVVEAARIEAASGPTALTMSVYALASRICHQRPERSFHVAASAWPVCARCSGLYLAAPFGAVAGLMARRSFGARRMRVALVTAALPTFLTIAMEWSGMAPVTNAVRAIAALPLGAAIACAVVVACREAPRPIKYTDRA